MEASYLPSLRSENADELGDGSGPKFGFARTNFGETGNMSPYYFKSSLVHN